jgi:hypothetical protein
MKASVQSIRRPILRAFFALLALWAIPGGGATRLDVTNSASDAESPSTYDATTGATRLYATRLYVTEFSNSTRVGAYDATTGAAINLDFITGLNDAVGLALSGNTLFVVQPSAGAGSGMVGKYNAITGAAINAIFITGLNQPRALACRCRTTPSSCRVT